MEFISLSELCKRVEKETKELKTLIKRGEKTWGRWVYHADGPYLELNNCYSIALDRITDLAAVGEWLLHLSNKTWVTNQDLGDLLYALKDLARVGRHSISYKGAGV
ncbi:MAG TPA: hypothetical protein VG122_01995 [Gemmata sp.]|jgi:hypothetical protein|nr:hypothetical protein [Gemmata sp.]